LGKPIKYLAVPPEEVLERVKKNVAEDAKKMITNLESLKGTEVITELKSLHNQGVDIIEPADLSGALRGRHNLYNHLEMSIKGAEKSVTIMTTEQGLIRKVDALKPVFEKLKKRGVKIRIAAPITKENMAAVKDLKDVAEIRHTDDNARFTIVDGKDITFMVMNDKEVHPTYDVGIWVNTPFFASALEKMFDSVWKNK